MPPTKLNKAVLAALGLTAGATGCPGVFGPCLDIAVETDTSDPGTDPDTDTESDSDTAASTRRAVLDRSVLPEDVQSLLKDRE